MGKQLKTRSLLQRFIRKLSFDEVTGCWLWTGTIHGGTRKSRKSNGEGYGALYDPKRGYKRQAHCISYEIFVGPIPAGLELDHLCRNRHCVNPEHLEPITHLENVRRGIGHGGILKKGKRKRGPGWRSLQKTHCPHGHPLSGENLYLRPDGARACRECCRIATQRWKKKHH